MKFEITKLNDNDYYTIKDNTSSIGCMELSNTVQLDGILLDLEDVTSVEKMLAILVKAIVITNNK